MISLGRALFFVALWASLQATGSAQVAVRGGLIVHGVVTHAGEGGESPRPDPDPAGPHVLDFTSGERLHGSLDGLDVTQERLTWRRSDASGPLAIPLPHVRRISFGSASNRDASPMATIKFTGGDWLTGQLTAIAGDRIHLQLSKDVRVTTNRAHVEWIYFSQSGAAECYDGPTSLAGWTSAGGWTYRDGALRSTSPGPIGRTFQALPDRVEYCMRVDQGEITNSFMLTLHNGSVAANGASGVVQLTMRTGFLQLRAHIDGDFKAVQADLTPLLGAPSGRSRGPLLLRVFEDFTGGRILVFINNRKAAEWAIDKGETGRNGGGFQFQPTSWSEGKEQSLGNIRVVPWDGREPTEVEVPTGDQVWLAEGGMKTGRITSWDGRTLQLGAAAVTRDQLRLLRFQRPANPPEDAAPVAQVRLAGRGEFDAVRLDWRDGKFFAATNFGGEIPLTPAQLAEVEFPRAEGQAPPVSDLLIFRNGDRVRGSLETADHAGKLRWQGGSPGPAVEFAPTHVAGLQFAPRVPGIPGGMVARFRNGDWLAGTFVTLDREQLVLDTVQAGRLSVPRALVKALYFGTDSAPAISDGAADHEAWERGLNLNTSTSRQRKLLTDAGKPWSYAAGTYALTQHGAGVSWSRSGGLQLGRMFETLAPHVEMSFTISSERSPVHVGAQLFTEPDNPGYMLHMSDNGISIYDMRPRARGRGNTQQQFSFGKEITPNARERHLRFLADRTSGRLAIIVDGVLVAQVAPRPADGPRELGRGVMITPQSNMPLTFSNLWVGPWNGQVPGKGATSTTETVALINGDEVQGTVETATPTTLKVLSEVGPIDLPIDRLTMVDFGGSPVEREPGTRLQLAGQGALTASAWRIENETVICRSEIAGELKLPLAFVQEIILPTSPRPAAMR